MPTGLFAIYMAEAWPVLTSLNSDVSEAVTWLGGAATMALALLATRFLIKGHLAMRRPVVAEASPVESRVMSPVP